MNSISRSRVALLSCLAFSVVGAQETFPINDVADQRADRYALTGVHLVVDSDTRLDDATVLIERGMIVGTGTGIEIPPGYVAIDLTGRTVIPGLIDALTEYGMPAPAERPPFSWTAAEVIDPQAEGAYNANQSIRSHYRAAEGFKVDSQAAADRRKLGFTAGLTYRADGLARGSAALVMFGAGRANEELLLPSAAAMYSFDKGSSPQSYPNSQMGTIAVLRQTYLDAAWYATQSPRPFSDQSLEGWLQLQSLPQIFATRNWQTLLKADELGDEFDVQYVLVGNGDEYRRLDAIKAAGAPLILPLAFPDAIDVRDPLEAREVSWVDLKHWELAPTNPAALASAGVEFALTAAGDDDFTTHLREAVAHGLDEATALAALTTVPAQLLGVQDRIGRIAPGYLANLVVLSGPWLDEDTQVEATWIRGQRHVVDPAPLSRGGRYALQIGDARFKLEISGSAVKPKASITPPGADPGVDPLEGRISFDDTAMTLSFDFDGPVRLSGWQDGGAFRGRAQLGGGDWQSFEMSRQGDLVAEPESDDKDAGDSGDSGLTEAGPVTYPFAPYGWTERPATVRRLYRNATVWTLDGEGRIENADVLIADGKIAAVGRDLSPGGAEIIDASGMHLTPGIIDEHSHIALYDVNDIATISAMVRMADVVDSDDVDIYRNLAGGVTAAQLLHGSANPVGGQSAIVKYRWGATPREMLIEDADGFIKFALGENVKRSRNPNSIRFPQSRMGVEAVYRDGFARARAYDRAIDEYGALSRRERRDATPPRRDLALETLAEIINGERFITCHSYVQSEINMLMHVADDFGFNINTFTHILEGYKVADKMAAHGAGGSSFSDWWAYKWEVRYAIPYNAALMAQAGVTVAINSDSSEMSRRLNQEAAKAVKYGGMDEIEALKLVTLNPARLLHLDHRMGSIEPGKDADLVLWSDHPLSIYAQVRQTLVDGRVMFDVEEDARRRDSITAERARLIARMLAENEKNGGGATASRRPEARFQCESLTGYEYLTSAVNEREVH